MTLRATLPSGTARALTRAAGALTVRNRMPTAVQRRLVAAAGALTPGSGTAVTRVRLGGIRAELVTGARDNGVTVLYLHGGGYTVAGPRGCRGIAHHLADQLQARVLLPLYRLAPEHPYPAGLHDAVAAYRALLDKGVPAQRIIVAGDSAGAGLALALAMTLRQQQLPTPAALALICPWLDPQADLTGQRTAPGRDPLLDRATLTRWARGYAAPQQYRTDPLLRPLDADLTGLPPLIVHSAADDPLADDAARLEHRARAAGTPVVHRRYDGMWHNFHLLGDRLPAAAAALGDLSAALRPHLPAAAADVRVGIIGAGVSGLCMGMTLRRAGVTNFTIYEKADRIGGTWRDNTYPGLTCDVPARFYSYSFALNPHWSQMSAPATRSATTSTAPSSSPASARTSASEPTSATPAGTAEGGGCAPATAPRTRSTC
jgi:acetyl esterase/lipase